MSKELDVSWFDLKKYDALAELDLKGWYMQIDARLCIIYEGDLMNEIEILSAIRELQNNPIWQFNDERGGEESATCHDSPRYPFNTYSVYSPSVYHVWESRKLEEYGHVFFQDVWNQCEKFGWGGNPEQDALMHEPYDFLYKKFDELDDGSDTHVTINLTATDEQILSDFQHWLTEYRKAVGRESNKKNFSDKDLACWYESRLLPYIDLTLSAAIEGKKITQAKIAELLCLDLDKLRKTIKPKAEWLFRHETLTAIEDQLSSLKGRYKKW